MEGEDRQHTQNEGGHPIFDDEPTVIPSAWDHTRRILAYSIESSRKERGSELEAAAIASVPISARTA